MYSIQENRFMDILQHKLNKDDPVWINYIQFLKELMP